MINKSTSNSPVLLFSNVTTFYLLLMLTGTLGVDVQCTEGLVLWRDSSRLINDELYGGYYQGNNNHKIDAIAAGHIFESLCFQSVIVTTAHWHLICGSST
jgi:hypothetical protein